MTSNDLKMTSKDKSDKTVSKKVKSKNILGGGGPNDDNPSNGRGIIEQAISSR